MGKKAPKAPDPVQLAQAQGAANTQSARDTLNINSIDAVNPFGSLTFGRDKDGNVISRTEAFNPQQQGIFNTQQGLAATLANQATNQAGFIPQDRFDLSKLGLQDVGNLDFAGLDSVQGFDSGRRGQIEDAAFNRATRLLTPEFERQEGRLSQSLADRGIVGAGADAERDRFERNRDFTLSGLANDAILAGSGEEARMFGQALAARGQGVNERFQNIGIQDAARTRGLNEALLQRQQPFNELSAFLQGSPSLNAPQFQPTVQTGVNPPDVIGANALSQGVQQNAFNQGQATQRGILSGLFRLGSAGIGR